MKGVLIYMFAIALVGVITPTDQAHGLVLPNIRTICLNPNLPARTKALLKVTCDRVLGRSGASAPAVRRPATTVPQRRTVVRRPAVTQPRRSTNNKKSSANASRKRSLEAQVRNLQGTVRSLKLNIARDQRTASTIERNLRSFGGTSFQGRRLLDLRRSISRNQSEVTRLNRQIASLQRQIRSLG